MVCNYRLEGRHRWGGTMPRQSDNPLKKLNVPWITKEGYLDLTKFPMDSILKQAVRDNEEELRSACQILDSMACAGRTEAGVFLYGLLRFYGEDLVKKGFVVKALRDVHTAQTAEILFDELNRTESSNTTRVYINTILDSIERLPLEMVEDGLEKLQSDSRWSHKMKHKFKRVLHEIRHRNEW